MQVVANEYFEGPNLTERVYEALLRGAAGKRQLVDMFAHADDDATLDTRTMCTLVSHDLNEVLTVLIRQGKITDYKVGSETMYAVRPVNLLPYSEAVVYSLVEMSRDLLLVGLESHPFVVPVNSMQIAKTVFEQAIKTKLGIHNLCTTIKPSVEHPGNNALLFRAVDINPRLN